MPAYFLPKFFRKRLVVAALGALALTGAAQAAPLTGFWQAYFEDGTPSGWFYFYEKNGFYEGRLVKMYKKKGETKNVTTCTACPGEKKGKPMLGMVIVYNLKKDGAAAKYENGNILDPRDGNIYNAEAEVTPDGQKLLLRGYLGLEIFGQTQTWTRLPDDAIPAAELPGDPLAPKPKPAAKPAAAKPEAATTPDAANPDASASPEPAKPAAATPAKPAAKPAAPKPAPVKTDAPAQ
ncbi:hypothetical protein M2321_000143 [Rhodoblastus acidophilus]|uniref:DUF2147 domain-containing protein n=1 Tax=Rhodoblastus acidophilus TaxID=1074 RepID=UPI0018B08E73|nr:DUF2147 domain-containing protein [Rhodoblastus acidophilus]MCW2272580.1 hypothetical protein [Rhodoblastus acidophilus]